ncbi:alpha/beta fold hydrolase [Paenibacillus sp. Y412MC10]|uniref:alpha/beta fold hydrolase n=1 Tax=Geobacillus sp. (strain Y412MC10) TaxID=481743 RepID=UPI0011AA43AA|nr:alpha/beta hydrolase [Paenibacillus sp. Y412MC10]
MSEVKVKTVRTPQLEIAYEEEGAPEGFPVILMHGFPDDVRVWDGTASILSSAGYRVLMPYLRGYGPTRFIDPVTPRVGQQAALGLDLLQFMDALRLEQASIAGYDWGCRACCVAAILSPKRIRALVAIGGYDVHDVLSPPKPAPPALEAECWYQWYFNTERGKAGLEAYRREICRKLWERWSPSWHFDDLTFERTAHSFENPDFVQVVIQEYRHVHRNDDGDPAFVETEKYLSTLPQIEVPAMVLHGDEDTVHPLFRSEELMSKFIEGTERRVVRGAGHFLPRQRPDAVAEALESLHLHHPSSLKSRRYPHV